jgi:hypothetical protein
LFQASRAYEICQNDFPSGDDEILGKYLSGGYTKFNFCWLVCFKILKNMKAKSLRGGGQVICDDIWEGLKVDKKAIL